MLKNYLKIALHNLLRHGFYSAINVAGLAIGFTCCLLISLFVAAGASVGESAQPNVTRASPRRTRRERRWRVCVIIVNSVAGVVGRRVALAFVGA